MNYMPIEEMKIVEMIQITEEYDNLRHFPNSWVQDYVQTKNQMKLF